jgi:GNAT superfamily N-acetyltransferase
MRNPPSPLPAGILDSQIHVGLQPYDAVSTRWVLARAEAELLDRYGELGDQELTLSAFQFTPPAGAFWVATGTPEGRVLGGVGLRPLSPGLGEVKRLWVDPEERGRGVAPALMTELERGAADRGCSSLRLHTGFRQPEAVALYERLGWTRRLEDWDGGPLAAGWILFSKELTS